jgi:hypothetical protein
VSVLAVTAVACSSSKKSSSVSTSVPTAPAASASVATAPATSATEQTTTSTVAAAVGGLSGTWNGQYSGAYNGTFVLNWQQTGSALTGTIKLSAPAVTLRINGTAQGNTISFGSVGGAGVTFSGTTSGSSMSGKYQVLGGKTATGGSWKASKL